MKPAHWGRQLESNLIHQCTGLKEFWITYILTCGGQLGCNLREVPGTFLTLIDDFSRNVSVYLLKSKDLVFNAFKTWKAMVEIQIRRRLRSLGQIMALNFARLNLKFSIKRMAL